MRVTYIGGGDASDSVVCTVFGHDFPRGEAVEMDAVPPKLRTNPTFVVEGDALDHDGDGKKGGDAPPAEDGERAELQAQLKALGVKFHHNAGVAALTALLEKATAPDPVAE